MKCPQCGFNNPVSTKFCGRCGTRLGTPCPSCGTLNPEEFAFCGTCGTALGAAAAPAPTEERKIVTILFADVTGSTTIAERLDPEQVRAIMTRFFEAMAEVITRHGGTVEKFIGDEVMAVFGIPTAHEDDPERAVRAALAMHERLNELNAKLEGSPDVAPQMRVGINTGEVIANPQATEKGEFMVTGDAVNVAARLRSAAAPGTTVVGERTHRHTAGVADYRACPPFTLKGKAAPVQGWEVVGLRAEPARRGLAGLRAPLIGRDGEFALLQGVLQRVIRERKPHLVTIFGAPGVGKTRIFEELTASLPPSVTVLHGRSLPYGSTSLWAVGEIIRADCGILRSDPLPVMTQKLRRRVGELLPDPQSAGEAQQVTGHLARVLAIRQLDPVVGGEGSRDELFWALRRYLERLSDRGPLIVAFEDLHWGDPELLDLVEYLAQWIHGPLLFLCLSRPELLETRPDWGGGKWNYSAFFLEPLGSDDTRRLLQELLRTETPPAEVAQAVTVAEGNPFFVEEILRMLIDAGALHRADGHWEIAGTLDLKIPDTVQGVITARLDRLTREEKSILQEAAVLGKDFWIGALAHLTGGNDQALAPLLHTLQAKDFMLERERSRLEGQREFTFKHIIIRDVAYGMLPKSRRSEQHRASGVWLEQTLGDRAEEFAELLAHHWLQAGRLAREVGLSTQWTEAAPKALQYTLMAGRKAARVYANDQAITHFQAARALAEELGADAERISATEGLADVYALQAQWDEASRLYQEALDYHQRSGDAIRQARVQSRIGSTYSGVFDFRQALPHVQSAMEALKSQQDERELAGVYLQMARTHTAMGQFTEAEEFARKGLQLAEQYALMPQNAEGEWVLAFISTLLGRSDAVAHYERCIEIARRVGELGWMIQGLAWKAFRHRWRAEFPQALEAYAQALSLAEETNNRPRIAFCHIGLGETHFLSGNWPAAQEAWRHYLERGEEVPAWVEEARAMLAFMQGNFTDAVGWAEKFIEHAERRREVTSIVLAVDRCAFLYLRVRRYQDARRVLAEALGRFTTIGVVWPAFFYPLAAEAALALGDIQSAADHCDHAETYHSMDLKPAQARLLRARGLVHAARQSFDEGVTLVGQAADLYRQIGQPYDLALTLEALAGVARRRGAPGDEDRSRDLLREAAAIYEKLGAAFEIRRLQESQPFQ